MSKEGSSKVPYFVAASAIGGAIGYLFLTESGRKVRDSIFSGEAASWIPDKIEDARLAIERRGNELAGKIQGVVDRAKDSIDEGTRVYRETEESLHSEIQSLDDRNHDVVGNIHRSIDNLNRTVHTIQETILDPLSEVGAIAKGIDRGIRRLFEDRRSVPRSNPAFYPSERRSG